MISLPPRITTLLRQLALHATYVEWGFLTVAALTVVAIIVRMIQRPGWSPFFSKLGGDFGDAVLVGVFVSEGLAPLIQVSIGYVEGKPLLQQLSNAYGDTLLSFVVAIGVLTIGYATIRSFITHLRKGKK